MALHVTLLSKLGECAMEHVCSKLWHPCAHQATCVCCTTSRISNTPPTERRRTRYTRENKLQSPACATAVALAITQKPTKPTTDARRRLPISYTKMMFAAPRRPHNGAIHNYLACQVDSNSTSAGKTCQVPQSCLACSLPHRHNPDPISRMLQSAR